MDEFGSFLKRINSRKASGFESAISGLFRSAWGSSFKPMPTPEWAGKESEFIYSPAMSIYGVSTAREFYAALEGADVTNGVLNRFLVIETLVRPSEQEPVASMDEVPAGIVAGLKGIYGRNPLAMLLQSTIQPDFEVMTFTPEARKIKNEMEADLRAKVDKNPDVEPFLARTRENAIRLATIVAIGCGSMVVDATAMIWGRDFSLWSTHRLAEGAGLYIADSENQVLANDVKRLLKAKGPRVPGWKLKKALAHKYKRREISDILADLVETREVVMEVEQSPKGGPRAYFYTLGGRMEPDGG